MSTDFSVRDKSGKPTAKNERGLETDSPTFVVPPNEKSSNCGGYTLEAEFGVTPNGYSEPDFMGWEIKQFGVSRFDKIDASVITLMTPEPTDGLYKTEGFLDRLPLCRKTNPSMNRQQTCIA